MSSQSSRSPLADALIDEVRERRRQLFTSCGDDLDELVRRIRAHEAEHPESVADPRTISPVPRPHAE